MARDKAPSTDRKQQQPLRDSVLSEIRPEVQEFSRDVTMAFLKEGIPLHKLENGPLRDIFDKYCSVKLPSVRTLRRMVPQLCEKNLEEIRENIGDSRIWLSVDEATDSLGRYIANVVVGKLDPDNVQKGYLIYVAQLEKTNASTIVQTVQEALRILWQGAPNTAGRLLLLVTDSVAYMLSAGKILKDIYPKVIHETCLAHGLHRVAEAIREEHPKVNMLISAGKKIFLKAPKRVEAFRKHLPGVALPPEPIITRWGTWLSAVSWYVKHFEGFKTVVKELEDDSGAVRKAKHAINDPALFPQLLFLEANFKSIPQVIEQLQSQNILLTTSVAKMEEIASTDYPGAIDERIKAKVQAVLTRNCGWEEIRSVPANLEGRESSLKESWDAADVLAMKYAPATSADVERTFSKLKYILSDRRHNFSMESVAAHVKLYYN